MSKKDDLIEIQNRIQSMTPEQKDAIRRQEIENKRNAVKLAKETTENKKTWKEVDAETEKVRMKANMEAELRGCPIEFQKLYKEYLALGNKIRNLQSYGNIKQIAEADELRDNEGKKLREKMLSIVHNGYGLTLKEEKRFISTVNEEHAVVENKGKWNLYGFNDENFTNIQFEFDPETGLPIAFTVNKRLTLLFNEPIFVKERHVIKYTNQEEIDRKKAEELKKRKPIKIVQEPKEYSCVKCHHVNDRKNKHCSECGYPKQSFQ